jgi:hypothetical protein
MGPRGEAASFIMEQRNARGGALPGFVRALFEENPTPLPAPAQPHLSPLQGLRLLHNG